MTFYIYAANSAFGSPLRSRQDLARLSYDLHILHVTLRSGGIAGLNKDYQFFVSGSAQCVHCAFSRFLCLEWHELALPLALPLCIFGDLAIHSTSLKAQKKFAY